MSESSSTTTFTVPINVVKVSGGTSVEKTKAGRYDTEVKEGCKNLAMGIYEHPYRLPKIEDPYIERDWLLNLMAGAFRVFAKKGFCEGPAGHISVRDPVDPNTFWINPLAVHFSLLTPHHMVHVDEDGTVIGGNRTTVNAAGFKIHSVIHQARPDVNCICHVHSTSGKAFSALGSKLDMLNQDACIFFNNHTVYKDFGGVVLESEEAKHIAEAMGPTNRSIILQNHGLLTVGSNVGEAAYLLCLMDKTCEVQMKVDAVTQNSNRYKRIVIGDVEAGYTYNMTSSPENLYSSFAGDYELEVANSNGALKSMTSYHTV